MADLDVPDAWTWPFTVADQEVIDALSDEQRASVERYARLMIELEFEEEEEEEGEVDDLELDDDDDGGGR